MYAFRRAIARVPNYSFGKDVEKKAQKRLPGQPSQNCVELAVETSDLALERTDLRLKRTNCRVHISLQHVHFCVERVPKRVHL